MLKRYLLLPLMALLIVGGVPVRTSAQTFAQAEDNMRVINAIGWKLHQAQGKDNAAYLAILRHELDADTYQPSLSQETNKAVGDVLEILASEQVALESVELWEEFSSQRAQRSATSISIDVAQGVLSKAIDPSFVTAVIATGGYAVIPEIGSQLQGNLRQDPDVLLAHEMELKKAKVRLKGTIIENIASWQAIRMSASYQYGDVLGGDFRITAPQFDRYLETLEEPDAKRRFNTLQNLEEEMRYLPSFYIELAQAQLDAGDRGAAMKSWLEIGSSKVRVFKTDSVKRKALMRVLLQADSTNELRLLLKAAQNIIELNLSPEEALLALQVLVKSQDQKASGFAAEVAMQDPNLIDASAILISQLDRSPNNLTSLISLAREDSLAAEFLRGRDVFESEFRVTARGNSGGTVQLRMADWISDHLEDDVTVLTKISYADDTETQRNSKFKKTDFGESELVMKSKNNWAIDWLNWSIGAINKMGPGDDFQIGFTIRGVPWVVKLEKDDSDTTGSDQDSTFSLRHVCLPIRCFDFN